MHSYPAQHPEVMVAEDMEGQEETQSTQDATQPLSQEESQTLRDQKCWGCLQPCSSRLKRIDLEKTRGLYNLGRGAHNEIRFSGFKVSNNHATIRWDGRDERDAVVTVQDLSSNGTFINGTKIGRGQSRILRDGNEISFGSLGQQTNALEDYRFIFRQTAGPPVDGIWAHYDMGEELGRGSFATVIKALSRQDGQWYAVKIMQIDRKRHIKGDELDSQGNNKKPFRREIEIMESLDHRNICKMREVFIAPDTLNIVLEWVKGGDLLDHIMKSDDGMGEEPTKDMAYQLCDALAYVHNLGIAHRDLKPENILLTTDVPPVVKVADFGLAKMVHEATWLKTMCGTPSYLAPEVVEQGETPEGYSHAVDSWSVGVIIFSMLTNTGPFLEDENLELKQRIASRQVDWSTLYTKGLSPTCVEFIHALLERNPVRRLSMAEALSHKWLRHHVPSYALREGSSQQSSALSNDTLRDPRRGGTYSRDQSMEDGEALMMDIEPLAPPPPPPAVAPNTSQSSTSSGGVSRIPGAYPKATPAALQRQASALVRRANVIAQAVEDGNELLQPSQEMLTAEERRRRGEPARPPAARAPVTGAGRGNKRKPEEDAEDAVMDDINTPNKRGRPTRGRARATPTGAGNGIGVRTRRSAKAEPIEEEDEEEEDLPVPAPRRSTRKRSSP